MDTKDSGFVLI